jgi:hypothetical protein
MRTPVLAALAALVFLAACGGGSKSSTPSRPPGDRSIQLTWNANHERAVNSPGGGYRVTITGRPEIVVPYVSGAFAPTSITTTLHTGSYAVTVRAFGALDAAGGNSGTSSAPAQLTVNVP